MSTYRFQGSQEQMAHAITISLRECLMMVNKDDHYNASWKKRGGTDSFYMLARKWDRIEEISKRHNYNILKAVQAVKENPQRESILEDIADLRNYLLLIEVLAYSTPLDNVSDYPDKAMAEDKLSLDAQTLIDERVIESLNAICKVSPQPAQESDDRNPYLARCTPIQNQPEPDQITPAQSSPNPKKCISLTPFQGEPVYHHKG